MTARWNAEVQFAERNGNVAAGLRTIRRYLGVVFREWWINQVAASFIVPGRFRYLFYRAAGMDLEKSRIQTGCWCSVGHFERNIGNLKIGYGTFVNRGCIFENLARVKIGRNCAIGMDANFCTSCHAITDDPGKRWSEPYYLPITIGDGCWIGTRATILGGVTVGEGCVIGAGALVTQDCPPNGLYVGVPARRIRDLPSTGASET